MQPTPDPWMEAMRQGDFAAAWRIADAVLAARDPATRDDPRLPYHLRWVWDGRALAGRDVVVRCYHGLGDTLQFARFLPALQAIAASVTLEVQPELLRLMRGMAGVDRVVPFDVAAPIPAETDIEIMELQHALRLVPDAAPYLVARRRTQACWEVGVCWEAGGWDASRSMPLALMLPALPPGTISLQREPAGLPTPLAIDADIGDTAAVIASLECVATVDTMVAHLAGALGRPVHVLLKAAADWRWGLGVQTPWYRSATLYRQAAPGDWSVPLAHLAGQLRRRDRLRIGVTPLANR